MVSGAAPYPATMYPADAFFGATALQSNAGKAAAPAATPEQRTHMLIFIAVLVVGGYLLWHFNYNR